MLTSTTVFTCKQLRTTKVFSPHAELLPNTSWGCRQIYFDCYLRTLPWLVVVVQFVGCIDAKYVDAEFIYYMTWPGLQSSLSCLLSVSHQPQQPNWAYSERRGDGGSRSCGAAGRCMDPRR